MTDPVTVITDRWWCDDCRELLDPGCTECADTWPAYVVHTTRPVSIIPRVTPAS